MDCNNTLTDAELKAMFAATNKVIPQIKQPMEYPIERTQHKWQKCARFFSNQAGHKQHHCEPSIKKEKHPHCEKPINHTGNLEKDLQEGSYTPYQKTVTSNDAGWTNLIQEWTLNTYEIDGGGIASVWCTYRTR